MVLTRIHKHFFAYFYYVILYKITDQVFMFLLVYVVFMFLIQLEVGFTFRNSSKTILQKFFCGQDACQNSLISFPQSFGQVFNAHSTHWQSFLQGFVPRSQFFSHLIPTEALNTTLKQQNNKSANNQVIKEPKNTLKNYIFIDSVRRFIHW